MLWTIISKTKFLRAQKSQISIWIEISNRYKPKFPGDPMMLLDLVQWKEPNIVKLFKYIFARFLFLLYTTIIKNFNKNLKEFGQYYYRRHIQKLLRSL